MLVRLLHGALALSLASEPAAAEAEPSTPTPDADDAAPDEDEGTPEPVEDAPTPEAGDANPEEPEPASETEEPEPETETEEPGPETDTEEPEPTPPPPAAATEAPRPISGPPPSGRNDDIVNKALLGGGIASLTLTAGLIGTSAWAWTEHNRAKRAVPNLTGDAQVDAQDRRDSMRTIGLVTAGTAALYGTTGVVLLLLRARDRNPPRTVLAPSPGGLSLTGRF